MAGSTSGSRWSATKNIFILQHGIAEVAGST